MIHSKNLLSSDLPLPPNLDEWISVTNNIQLPTILPRDYAISIAIGACGAYFSVVNAKPFVNLHHDVHRKKNLQNIFGHGNSPNDQVDGYLHRLKFGHDLFNPIEVFNQNTAHFGGAVIGLQKWILHLIADSFSKEGLPFPGLPTVRKWLDISTLPNREEYQSLMTLKARDISAAMLVEAMVALYLKSESLLNEQATPLDSTRGQLIRFMSHSSAAFGGLMVTPTSLASFSHPSAMFALKSLYNLIQHWIRDEKNLHLRQEILDRSKILMMDWDNKLQNKIYLINNNFSKNEQLDRLVILQHLKILGA